MLCLTQTTQKNFFLHSPQVTNIQVLEENTRLKFKWEDPVESEYWSKTYVLTRTDRFPEKVSEIGTSIKGATSKAGGTTNAYKDSWFIASGLTNGIPLYCVIVTANPLGEITTYNDTKFILTPKQTYEFIKDENGQNIGIRPIP